MTTLTSDQIAQDMRNAGFPESVIPVGIAIVMGESSGNTDAVNNSDPYGGSWGLWQINGAHFQNGTTLSCALDAQCATNYAFQLSNGGTNWNPWGAYTNGSYKQFLPTNTIGNTIPNTTITAQNCTPKNCTCPTGYHIETNSIRNSICRNDAFPYNAQVCNECASTDPVTSIGNFFNNIQQLTTWLSDPVRIIKLVFGILLIGGSIFLIASPQSAVARGITQTVRKAGMR